MPTIEKVNSAKNIRASIRYARDSKDKQGHPKLHDEIGINCNPNRSEYDFESTNFVNQWSNRRHIQLKKFVLGFGPLNNKTLSSREAHIYAKRLLNKYNERLGGGWRIAAYAHKDHPESYHYHVLINNCNIRTGQKLTTTYKDVKKLRELNDKVSHSFGMKPVQKSRLVAKDMPEIKGQENAKGQHKARYSFQDHVRTIISQGILVSKNLDEFKSFIHQRNMKLRPNFFTDSKNSTVEIPSINPQGKYNRNENGVPNQRRVKANRLGLAFDKKSILTQLSKPFSERNYKYLKVYMTYAKSPNSVDFNSNKLSPFMNSDSRDSREKTSDKYLNNYVVRDNFKSKGEITNEKQLNLVRTIRELNQRFQGKEQIAQGSEQSTMEHSSTGNRQERQLNRAKQAVKKPISPIKSRSDYSDRDSVRRAERAVKRAKQQIGAISTSSGRKQRASSTGQSIKRANSKSESTSGRERPASSGQQRLRITYQHFGVKAPGQDLREDRSNQFISQKEQRRIKGYSTVIQRGRESLKRFEQIRWEELHQKLRRFRKFFQSVETATQSVKSSITSIAKSVQSRVDIKQFKGKNQSNEKSSQASSGSAYQDTLLSRSIRIVNEYTKSILKPKVSKNRSTLYQEKINDYNASDKVNSAQLRLDDYRDKEDKQFRQKVNNYNMTHSDTYSDYLDREIAKQHHNTRPSHQHHPKLR